MCRLYNDRPPDDGLFLDHARLALTQIEVACEAARGTEQPGEARVCYWLFAGTGGNLAVGVAAHFARGGARSRDYTHDEVFT